MKFVLALCIAAMVLVCESRHFDSAQATAEEEDSGCKRDVKEIKHDVQMKLHGNEKRVLKEKNDCRLHGGGR